MYNLILEDWGGFVTPWVEEIARSFRCLKVVHFRRMIVTDEDLELLARARGHVLKVLKLDKCSGFSTDGLLHICRSCRLGNIEYVVCRDENGELRAFHNVCRHHASLLVSESGKGSCFVCPYHGWTYGLNGTLLKQAE